MYQTGGGVVPGFWVALAVLIAFLVYAFWPALQLPQFSLISFFLFLMSALFWGGIGYGIYRLFRRR
jgi:hypothetical protein